MCLGEVAEVIGVRGREADVAGDGRRLTVSLLTLDDGADEPLAPGDWVLVHSGFALARLTEAEAQAALETRRGGPHDEEVRP